jgi:hypothetical protein
MVPKTVTENQIAVVGVSYIVRNYSAQLGFVFFMKLRKLIRLNRILIQNIDCVCF